MGQNKTIEYEISNGSRFGWSVIIDGDKLFVGDQI